MKKQRHICTADFYSRPDISKGRFRLGGSTRALHFASARAVSGSRMLAVTRVHSPNLEQGSTPRGFHLAEARIQCSLELKTSLCCGQHKVMNTYVLLKPYFETVNVTQMSCRLNNNPHDKGEFQPRSSGTLHLFFQTPFFKSLRVAVLHLLSLLGRLSSPWSCSHHFGVHRRRSSLLPHLMHLTSTIGFANEACEFLFFSTAICKSIM